MRLYLTTLKNKPFSFLFASILFSNLANSIANISLIWLAYNKFNTPLIIAGMLGALQLPSLIIGPFLGGLLDKFQKTNLMIFANFVNTLVFIFLIFNNLNTNNNVIIFILLLVISGSMKPLLMGGDSMVIQDIFPNSEDRIPANALTTMSFDLTYIFGSMLSGVVIALGYGFKVYTLVGCLYLLVVGCLFVVKNNLNNHKINISKSEYGTFFSNFINALNVIFKNSELVIVLIMDFLWNMLLWAGLTVLLPVVVKVHLSYGAGAYGLLESMTSIGIVLGSFLIGQIRLKKNSLVFGVICSIGLHGILFITLGLTYNLWVLVIGLIFIGIVVSPALIYKTTFYQQTFDDNSRGALFTIAGTMTSASYPIGIMITSLLSTYFSSKIGFIFVIYGLIITFISSIAIFNIRPKMVK